MDEKEICYWCEGTLVFVKVEQVDDTPHAVYKCKCEDGEWIKPLLN